MKKRLTAIALLAAMTIPTAAAAQSNMKQISVRTGLNVRVDGEVVQMKDANGNPVDVFEYNGTTYVPLRGVAQALGADVGYDSATNTATVDLPVESPPMVTSDDMNLLMTAYLDAEMRRIISVAEYECTLLITEAGMNIDYAKESFEGHLEASRRLWSDMDTCTDYIAALKGTAAYDQLAEMGSWAQSVVDYQTLAFSAYDKMLDAWDSSDISSYLDEMGEYMTNMYECADQYSLLSAAAFI